MQPARPAPRRVLLPLLAASLLLCGGWGESFTYTATQKPVPLNERKMPPNPPLPPTQPQVVVNRIGLLRYCMETLRQFEWDPRTVGNNLARRRDAAGTIPQRAAIYDAGTHGFVLQARGYVPLERLAATENHISLWLCNKMGPQSKGDGPIPPRLAQDDATP